MDLRNNENKTENGGELFGVSGPAAAPGEAGWEEPARRTVTEEKPRYLLIAGILFLLFIAAAAASLFLYKSYYRPTVDTGVPFAPVTSGIPAPVSDESGAPETDGEKPNDDGYVRNTSIVNFLVLGTDRYAMNTDVIMIVNFNSETKQINIVQVMRDTWIRYDGIKERINTVYSHFYNKTGSSEKAMKEVEKVFEQAFSIQIDYYALVDLAVFREVVDAVGGVYINVPFDYDYDDPWQDLYIHLKAGYQLLDGEKAEQFVRYRAGYALADKGRTDAQKMFFSALLTRVKETFKSNVSAAVNVGTSVLRNMDTNLTGAEMGYYIPLMMEVDLSSLRMSTIYADGVKISPIKWVVSVNREVTLTVVNRLLNVYNRDITDDLFDTGRMLVDPENEEAVHIYYQTGLPVEIVSGDKTDEIYIIPN